MLEIRFIDSESEQVNEVVICDLKQMDMLRFILNEVSTWDKRSCCDENGEQ